MAEKVFMRDCGDGYRRADVGSFSPVVVKTADYTILPTDAGALFSNRGAAGAVVFTLPVAKSGLFFKFLRQAAQNVTVTATSGAAINGSAANGSYILHGGTAPAPLRVLTVWSDGTDWFIAQANQTKVFVSAEQTGTGAAQNIAHGLGVVPLAVFTAPTDTAPATAGVYTVAEGAHDATNVVVTVTSGKKYKILALA